jgi:Cu/Ag efflux protein CusF
MPVHVPKLTFPAALVALALGCATSSVQAPKSAELPKYQESSTHTATATVQSIDLATRRVTLREKDGNTFAFTAGPQVRNLDQIQVGDLVAVTYTETFSIEVKRADGSTPNVTSGTAADRAAVGEKPAGSVARVTTISAVVMAVDKEIGRVTVKGPEGNVRILQVKDPKRLESVKVGDLVVATYTESLGVAVEKVPAAK